MSQVFTRHLTLGHTGGTLWRVPNINDPWLSEFERWELQRETTGDLPFWTSTNDADLKLLHYWDRLNTQPDWTIKATFEIENFRLLDVAVAPATMSPPTGGLTADIIRRILVGDLYAKAREYLLLPVQLTALDIERDRMGHVKRPGRQGRDDLFYARFAQLYVEELAAGPAPIPRLVQSQNLSASSIRGFLHEARRRKLLTDPPYRGAAGGQLTDKGRLLLSDEDHTTPTLRTSPERA